MYYLTSLFMVFSLAVFSQAKIPVCHVPVPKRFPVKQLATPKSSVKSNVGMKRIPAGIFAMGSHDGQGRADEYPIHKVQVKAFWMDETEVTNAAFAAIDIGSNSTNLLIANPDGSELVREVHVTGLGRGVVHSNQLQPDAIERTINRLQQYKALITQHGCGIVRVTATEACRRATNSAVFLDAAEQVLGTRPEIIAGETEARLAFAGAISHFPAHDGTTLVIDIGGGSTEVMIGDTQFRHAMSFPVGTVVLTESELHHDPPKPEELTNAIGLVTDFMDDLLREHPDVAHATRVIGVAGSIVTIAAVEIGLQQFDATKLHGHSMSRSDVEEVFRTLATEKLADRKHNPGLPADRADVIVVGCCVLVGIMRRLHLAEITVSVNNLLDGVIAQELSAP